MPAGMRRALTVGLPLIAAAASILAAAVEIAFLVSPAAGFCPEHPGFLSYCFFPPSSVATFTIWLALGLTVVSVISCVFAWRGRLGAAGASALPGLIGVVVVLLAALANQNSPSADQLQNTPPEGYWLYGFGGAAVLVGMVLLAAACCVQLAVRFARIRRPL
jgi:hypothetical protein